MPYGGQMPQGGLPTGGLEWKSGRQARWKTGAPKTHTTSVTQAPAPRPRWKLRVHSTQSLNPSWDWGLGIGKQWGTKWGAGRWEP
jgi:hypothetical protein